MKAIKNIYCGILTAALLVVNTQAATKNTIPSNPNPLDAAGNATSANPASPNTPDTTQEHLNAAQKDLNQASTQLRDSSTVNRGGFVEKARTDLKRVLADIKEASAYVTAHPEVNPLAPGPVPMEPAKLHPDILLHKGSFPHPNLAIDDLNAALNSLVNNPAVDFHGPILGDIGGIREKIITDIVKTADDILAAETYAEAHPESQKNTATDPAPAPAPAANKPPAPAAIKSVTTANKPLTPDQLKALVLVEGDYSSGTGFVAKMHEQYFVVTNLHVLSGNKKFTITGMDGAKYPTTGTLFGAMDRDIAIMKIPAELAKNYFELQDDPFTNALAGDVVTVPGNSNGAGIPTQSNGKVIGVGPELVEVDAKFVEGNSGSPIVHRLSGKVIGIATFAITYKLDDLNKAAKVQDVRWFGLRLDNIDPKQWETLDWKHFSDEGLKMRDLENLTSIMVALLRDQKLPPTSNDQVVAAIATYQTNAALATKRKSERDVLGAIQSFMQTLVDLSKSDIRNLSDQKLYIYDANRLKKQQDLLVIIDKAFATASKQISSFKNSL